MTENETKKGVDLTQFTESEEPAESNGLQEMIEENQKSHDELIAALQEEDPILAMITAQIFDIGNVVGDLVKRVDMIEKHVGYLLSQDKEVQKRMAEAQAALKSEDQNAEPDKPGSSEESS